MDLVGDLVQVSLVIGMLHNSDNIVELYPSQYLELVISSTDTKLDTQVVMVCLQGNGLV